MPMPSPRVAENAKRTFTVGPSQFLSLSLLLRLRSNCWTRSRSTGRISAGESQDCNWVARGWVRSLFFVVFSYASKAALKTDWKSVDEDEDEDGAAGAVWDMVLVEKNQPEHRPSLCITSITPTVPQSPTGCGTADSDGANLSGCSPVFTHSQTSQDLDIVELKGYGQIRTVFFISLVFPLIHHGH